MSYQGVIRTLRRILVQFQLGRRTDSHDLQAGWCRFTKSWLIELSMVI
jgi:hypothetical protein